CQQGYDNPWTF
nr:immunoglobulin light chain junction region [Macaca mulatta]MOV76648.1 immunoglobulin light chain junction region [Macaca mulatta]